MHCRVRTTGPSGKESKLPPNFVWIEAKPTMVKPNIDEIRMLTRSHCDTREELIEVFKVKSLLAEKGVNIPANNYWTSSEGDGEAGWSAYYVNFYEDTNIVSEICSKSGWKIGVLPIRAY